MARNSREIRDALLEGRYKEAYRLCENARGPAAGEDAPVDASRAEIYFLGACALFGLGHVHQAEEWVREHGRLTNQGPDFLYLQAYLRLHKRNFKEALLDWTRILQLDPSRTLADELIDKLKEGEARVFREISEPENFVNFVPLGAREGDKSKPAGKPASPGTAKPAGRRGAAPGKGLSRALIALAIIVLTGIALGLVLAYAPGVAGMFARFRSGGDVSGRADLPNAPARGTVIPREQFGDAPPRFIYDDRDAVLKEFGRARSMIARGAVNQARYLLGKIELSNAGFEIKERALLLRDVIPDVQRERFRDPVEIKAIYEEPYLFRGAQVLWTGRVRDVNRLDKSLEFSLDRVRFAPAVIRVNWPSRRGSGVGLSPEDIKEGLDVRVFGVFREKDKRNVLKVEAFEVLGLNAAPSGSTPTAKTPSGKKPPGKKPADL